MAGWRGVGGGGHLVFFFTPALCAASVPTTASPSKWTADRLRAIPPTLRPHSPPLPVVSSFVFSVGVGNSGLPSENPARSFPLNRYTPPDLTSLPAYNDWLCGPPPLYRSGSRVEDGLLVLERRVGRDTGRKHGLCTDSKSYGTSIHDTETYE